MTRPAGCETRAMATTREAQMTSPDESPDQLLRPASAARAGGPDSSGPQVAAQRRHTVAPTGPPPVSARPAPASGAPGSRRNRIAIAVLIELLAAAGIIGALIAWATHRPTLGMLAWGAAIVATLSLWTWARTSSRREATRDGDCRPQ